MSKANLGYTLEEINDRLGLIDVNKNLLPYPYTDTLPSGLTNVEDGSILTSGEYSSQTIMLKDALLLDAGTYIVSLTITDITERPTTVSGFKLIVTDGAKSYKTEKTTDDGKKTYQIVTLDAESTVKVELEIPEGATTGLLIKPQLEKAAENNQPTDWVPNMDKIGTYVDRRFNGTNAKIKVLADYLANFADIIEIEYED